MNEFEKALELTMKLHALFKEGQGASDAADAIRDQLDPYYGWGSSAHAKPLSSVEKQLLKDVTVALYKHHV